MFSERKIQMYEINLLDFFLGVISGLAIKPLLKFYKELFWDV